MNKRQRKKSTKSLINAAARSGKRMNALGYKAIAQGKVDLASVLTEAYKSYKANAAIRRREDEIRSQMRQLENKDRSRRRGANKNKWTGADIKKYAKLKSELNIINPQVKEKYSLARDAWDDADQKALTGALVKKYHDYVDAGYIKPRHFIDNYEQAAWMRDNVLSEAEMEEAVATADRWLNRRNEAVAERTRAALSLVIDF